MNRPIDVHYSLPKPEEVSGGCDRDKNQGSLVLSLANRREPNPVHLRRLLTDFGDIKELRPGQVKK